MRPKVVDREVVVELDLDERHLQALGTAHGGAIASVLDSAIALNINKKLVEARRVAVTAQLNVHYLRPASKGRVVEVGRPIHIGTKTAVGYSKARIGGDVITVATAVLVIKEMGGGRPA
jgi:uncharacterized protein (TIGR00369 family)